jgi:hypothetical protein
MRNRLPAVFISGALVVGMFWGCDEETETTSGPSSSPSVTATGPSSTSTMSGGVTTTATGGMNCTGIMASENAACNTCIQNACCAELLQCQQSGFMNCQSLLQCANTQGGCQECFFPICDAMYMGSQIGYVVFAEACAGCTGTNCCQILKDCLNDVEPGCSTCLLNGTGCDSVTLDDQLTNCQGCSCPDECGGGAGGGLNCGGMGGTGGVGGSMGGAGGTGPTTSSVGGGTAGGGGIGGN